VYSPDIEKVLGQKKAKVGDRVRITKGTDKVEGMLMAQTEA